MRPAGEGGAYGAPREGGRYGVPWRSSNDPDAPGEFREGLATIIPRVSWGAVFAGAVVVLVVMMMLNMLGIGIGLASMNPTEERNPLSGLGPGAAIWWVVSWLISLFAGGWVASRLSGRLRKGSGALHGIVTWGVASIVLFWMLWSGAAGIVSTTAQATGQVLQTAGRGAVSAVTTATGAEPDPQAVNQLEAQTRETLAEAGVPPEVMDVRASEVQRAAVSVLRAAMDPDQAVDRRTIVQILSRETQLTQEQSERLAERWEGIAQDARARMAQTEQQVRQTTEEVAGAVGTAAIIAFFVLLIGGIAAAIGGWIGTPREILVIREDRAERAA